jgi:HlyD family secretion protein
MPVKLQALLPGILRKHPVIALIALLVIGLLVWGYWPQPVLVEAVSVKRAPMTVSIEEEGRTRVIDRYVIAAPVDGVTCRVQLNVGDQIKQGEVLLGITPLESQVLDPRSRAEARARVAAAESALESARDQAQSLKATSDFSNSEVKRLRPLYEKGVIPKGEFDKAQMNQRTAKANLRSARHAVEVATYELQAARSVLEYHAGKQGEPAERVPVTSPINGRILKVHHECKGPVRTGEPLLEVGDPEVLEVEVDVLSSDAVKIKPGMAVMFDRWGGEQPLQGIVRNIEPVGFTKISALGVEEQRVLIIVDFTSPKEQWQRLGDGYRVDAPFMLWRADDVLQVPASSVFRHNDSWAVFVIDDQRARLREVKIGQRNGLVAQILEGLQEGQPVIIHPSDQVEDTVRVKVR